MAFSKAASHSQGKDLIDYNYYLQTQREKLQVERDSVAFAMTSALFSLISSKSIAIKCTNTRILIVKWVLEYTKYNKMIRNHLKHVCWEYKGARMTHIMLIKNEIWNKREYIIKIIKENHPDMIQLIKEIEIFEKIVVPHIKNKKYFPYLKLLHPETYLNDVSRNKVPILSHAALELAKSTVQPSLKNYVLPTLEPGLGIMKQQVLMMVRSNEKENHVASVIAPQKFSTQKQLRVSVIMQ